MSSSKFDIVVYGATGFTGQLVAEYLATHYKGDATLKWAMAGRSKDKLAAVRDAIGAPADTPLIVADASDPASLKAMVDQATSVISTVGPYQFYGNELLAACVASGTDYFDLCGEPLWMRQMIDKHEAAAKAVGRSRSAVTNLLRLLALPKPVQDYLLASKLEMGHARALLALPAAQQASAATRVVEQQLSVRETERFVHGLLNPAKRATRRNKPSYDTDTARLENDIEIGRAHV